MLLNIYLATTAVNFVVTISRSVAITLRFKREGYKFNKDNRPKAEKTAELLIAVIKSLLPVYNILYTASVIFLGNDRLYEMIKEKYLEEGRIYKENDHFTIQHDTKNDFHGKNNYYNNSNLQFIHEQQHTLPNSKQDDKVICLIEDYTLDNEDMTKALEEKGRSRTRVFKPKDRRGKGNYN